MTAPVNRPEPETGAARTGGRLLAVASVLLLLLAAAQGYVSFRAQYAFIDRTKHAQVPSMLEALGLDTGAVIFALLALSLARRGRRGTVERVLNVSCAVGSLIMNLLAADMHSPRSVTVWVLPSALYALASDRLIAVVRRWVQSSDPDFAEQSSAWRALAGLVLWPVRLVFDASGTLAGFRRWVLVAAPVAPGMHAALTPADALPALPAPEPTPGPDIERPHTGPAADQESDLEPEPSSPTRSPDDGMAPGETKRAALIRLYERCGESGDPRYGDRAKAAELAGEIARRIGYHPGTARRELVKYLATEVGLVPAQPAGAGPDAEEVA